MEKEMEMVNISTLPLTVTLALNYPFTLVLADDRQTQRQTLVLQSGEVVKVRNSRRFYSPVHLSFFRCFDPPLLQYKVLFDPCYKTEDWVCRSINSQITVSYKEHPHLVRV